MGGCYRCCRCYRLPPPKHREPPLAPPVGVGRARCGGGDASSPSPRHRLPPPDPPSRPPPLRRRPGDRGFRLLLCRWGGNSLQPWSPGQADSHRRQHRLPPLSRAQGSPRRRRRGGGGPVGGGPPPGAVGAHMQDAAHRTSTLTVRGGGRRAAPPRTAGTMGTPSRIANPAPRPAAPHLPSRRGPGAPRGASPPHLSARQSGSRPPVPCPPPGHRGPFAERGWRRGRRGGD